MNRWPLLLALFVLLLAPQPAGAVSFPARSHGAQPAAFQEIDAYVSAQIRAMHIPGAALGIVRGTEIVHLQGYGVANPAGQPMTPQTPVILGSTSKSFTALAVMQLVEAGKLSLDAPVQRYLPSFRPGSVFGAAEDSVGASAITVRHLLSHTSGIPTGGTSGASIAVPTEQSVEDAVRALETLPLTAPPGARYQYSNSNYVALGALVEAVTGQTYASYIRDRIFEPLRMQHSSASKRESRPRGLAAEHRWWFGLPISQDLPYPRASVPAGYLISSAQDMAQYLVAQLNEGRYLDRTVLSPNGIAQLHHPVASMDPRGAEGGAYGMGWAVGGSAAEPSIFHSGETPGSHSDLIILPAQRLGIVVLTNVNGNAAIATGAQAVIAQGVQRLLLGQQPPAESLFWPRYLAFDAALFLGSALAIWSLVRLLARSSRRPQWRPATVLTGIALPLLWELALPIWLLASLPSLAQASWPLTLLFFPDLGYWLLALCAVLLATAALRVGLAFPRTNDAVRQLHFRQPRRVAVALSLATLVTLLGMAARPSPPSLSTAVTGDAALAARALPLLPGALDRVSIAVVDGPTTTYAHFGADEHTQYEIGSITKTFTAQLLADAIDRGEVTAEMRVGALLPLDGAPVAGVTLAELASHRSGLSAQGMLLDGTIPFLVRHLSHRNPFIHDAAGVIAIARKAPLTTRGTVVYSNLGVALLGHALAEAARTDYVRLVQERLLMPLDMRATSLPLTRRDLPHGATTGYSAGGVREAPWAIDGWVPAGGARSTTADMVRFARALLDGSAPGMDALEPQWVQGSVHVGYVWTAQDHQGHTVTAKSGLTGGFTSKIALDRANHRAVIVLSNTAAQVETAANSLLVGDHAWTPSR